MEPLWKPLSVSLLACMQRLGSKGVLGDFARSLCNLLAPNLVAPMHVVGLMRLARSQEEAAAPVAQDLLLQLAPADPGLVAASADQVLAGCGHGLPFSALHAVQDSPVPQK